MATLEEKLLSIEQKWKRLTDLNAHYKQTCIELAEMNRLLESEIDQLQTQLSEKNLQIAELQNAQLQTPTHLDTQNRDALKKQIEHCIQEINTCMDWVQNLE
jgi:hypothetical protein